MGHRVSERETCFQVALVVLAIYLKVNEVEQVSIDQDDGKQARSLKLAMVGQQLSAWGLSIILVRLVVNIVDKDNNTTSYCMNNQPPVRGQHLHANVFIVAVSCHDSVETDQICDLSTDHNHFVSFVRFWFISFSTPLHPPRVIRFAQ